MVFFISKKKKVVYTEYVHSITVAQYNITYYVNYGNKVVSL